MATTIFDTKEEIPESLREKAQEVEGKFHLDATSLIAKHNEILAEKKSRDAEVARLKAEADKFKDLDPGRARAALKAVEEAETAKLKAQGDWDAREKALNDGFTAKESAFKTQLAERETALDRFVVFNELARVAALPEIKACDAELLEPHVTQFIRRKGLSDYEILDKTGQVRYGSDGNPLRMDAYLTELRNHPKLSRLFDASGASGSGAPASNGAGGKTTSIKRAAFNALDPAARMAAIKAKTAIVD